MKARKLLLTFDYELFLGKRSGSVEKSLLAPTQLLLELLKTHELKNAIFFVDTAWLYRMQQQGECKSDLDKILKQLGLIVQEGHFVFPHIHPHWLNAEYLPQLNQWCLDNYSKYRFHHASKEERILLFTHAAELLAGVCEKDTRHFSLIGYRAGGWSIQPFSDFREYFIQHGITHEFSVVKGFRNISQAQYFDFTSCTGADIYRFDEDPCIEKNDGPFREYTISTLPVPLVTRVLNKIWNKYLWKTGNRSMGDGLSASVTAETGRKTGNDSGASSNRDMLSIESLTLPMLPLYRKHIDRNPYTHFISHPKMLSRHNLMVFDKWLRYATGTYELHTSFLQF
jgi:hypothetical protein